MDTPGDFATFFQRENFCRQEVASLVYTNTNRKKYAISGSKLFPYPFHNEANSLLNGTPASKIKEEANVLMTEIVPTKRHIHSPVKQSAEW